MRCWLFRALDGRVTQLGEEGLITHTLILQLIACDIEEKVEFTPS